MTTSLPKIRRQLDRLTQRRSPMPPPQVLIDAPGLRFEYGDLAKPYHCASVDKVFLATLIAHLVDAGRLAFDSPLGAVLPATDLAGLPAADGVNIATDVTVEHLLTHTSGLPDYFDAPRGQDVATSMARVAEDPDRKWTRADILDVVRTMRAVGRPGERFAYSDTAYLLLTRVAEEAGASGYADLLRTHVFTPSGLTSTRMAFDDSLTPQILQELNLAPIWFGGHELSTAMCLSVGWGSITTVAEDLVRFQHALHGGELITSESLEHLTRPRNRMRAGIHYGAGAVTLRFGEFMPLLLRGLPEPVGGLGLSAAHMFYYPAQQAHVVMNFHSTKAMNASFRSHLAIARALVKHRDAVPLAWGP